MDLAKVVSFVARNQSTILSSIAIVVAAYVFGHLARWLVASRLSHLADKTSLRVDDALVASLRGPLPVWFTLGGVYVALRLYELPNKAEPVVNKALTVLWVTSITFWAAGLVGRLLQRDSAAAAGIAPTGVVRQVARIAVLAVGVLVLLSTLGISIAPVLTTVGIGGLAVALGLQETLSNLFAGMQLTFTGNIRVGDFVKLESGDEGYVEDIQWRVTRVRTLSNNFVLIPNSKLAQSVLTNFHQPGPEVAVLIGLGVHYKSDLELVERVTSEVGKQIMQNVKGAVPEFEPFIRYHTFGDSSIDFTVILRAKEFTDQYLIKHEFVKSLSRAYAQNGIVIPFPIRAVNLDQEAASAALLDARRGVGTQQPVS
jgi:small-conductance mechanosensitive channel